MKKFFRDFSLFPLFVVFISTFGLAAFEKFSGGLPEWFIRQFEKTPINLFPGAMPLSFYALAVLEGVTTLAFIVSLSRREFLPDRPKPVLDVSLVMAQFVFAILGIGQRMSHDFNGAFQLFAYFAMTFLVARNVRDLTSFS